jgi:hypothetical protein
VAEITQRIKWCDFLIVWRKLPIAMVHLGSTYGQGCFFSNSSVTCSLQCRE